MLLIINITNIFAFKFPNKKKPSDINLRTYCIQSFEGVQFVNTFLIQKVSDLSIIYKKKRVQFLFLICLISENFKFKNSIAIQISREQYTFGGFARCGPVLQGHTLSSHKIHLLVRIQ